MSTWAAYSINPTSIVMFFEGLYALRNLLPTSTISKAVYAGLYALPALFHIGSLSPPIKKGAYIKNGLIISMGLYSGKRTVLTCSIYTPTRALASGAYNPPIGP